MTEVSRNGVEQDQAPAAIPAARQPLPVEIRVVSPAPSGRHYEARHAARQDHTAETVATPVRKLAQLRHVGWRIGKTLLAGGAMIMIVPATFTVQDWLRSRSQTEADPSYVAGQELRDDLIDGNEVEVLWYGRPEDPTNLGCTLNPFIEQASDGKRYWYVATTNPETDELVVASGGTVDPAMMALTETVRVEWDPEWFAFAVVSPEHYAGVHAGFWNATAPGCGPDDPPR